MKKKLPVSTLMVLLAFSVACGFNCAGSAPGPALNVSGKRHPNLAAAQRFLLQAYGRIGAAQKANEWDLGGHAEKAKALIDQASAELKLAAKASNDQRGN
jgi:hypothetical protein